MRWCVLPLFSRKGHGKVHANSALSFFRRNFGKCNQDIKIKCYETYICPICEYATVIWSPHLQSNIYQIEMIQRKATRFVFSDYPDIQVSAMFDWRSLEKRRDISILIMLHKIINQYIDIPHNHILHTAPRVAAANSCICPQELILSNIHFFQQQSDNGITYQITLWKLVMLTLLNHCCSYLLNLLVFSLLTNHVHYTCN